MTVDLGGEARSWQTGRSERDWGTSAAECLVSRQVVQDKDKDRWLGRRARGSATCCLSPIRRAGIGWASTGSPSTATTRSCALAPTPRSTETQALTACRYSGGRDGVICAWDLNLDVRHKSDSITAINAKPPPSPASTLHNQVQAHTHWINDLVLAQSNQALVSASSDISVKVWRPAAQDSMPPQTIGLHTDYVKVLASPSPDASWVASGALDGHICLWDLNGHGKKLSIDIGQDAGLTGISKEKTSVYALQASHSILASGGPDSNVCIWDPKSGKRITKFVGHTDIVRDILISQDGTTVMSACSDETVKVWSVTAGRCMNTLTMHDASVWSLWSDHPDLSVFYSADKSGLVAKTDTRGCHELEEGMSVALCHEGNAVHKMAVAGDYLWTATSRPTINRWADVNTDGAEIDLPENYRQKRVSLANARSRLPSPPNNSSSDRLSSPVQATPPTSPPVEKRKIPLKHNLRLSNTVYFPRPIAREVAPDAGEVEVEHTQPVRHIPDFSIEGQNGLVKHIMLNDRKRVLTQDTAGEVLLWDLLKVRYNHESSKMLKLMLL